MDGPTSQSAGGEAEEVQALRRVLDTCLTRLGALPAEPGAGRGEVAFLRTLVAHVDNRVAALARRAPEPLSAPERAMAPAAFPAPVTERPAEPPGIPIAAVADAVAASHATTPLDPLPAPFPTPDAAAQSSDAHPARTSERRRAAAVRLSRRDRPERPATAPAPRPEAGSPRTLGIEQWIGERLFQRLALVLVVVGVAWIFKYAYDLGMWGRLPAVVKVALGALAGGGLVTAGVRLERRPEWRTWGLGLVAGGWPILYLTAYAAHHFEASRIVADPLAALALFVSVAAGGVAFSLRYRREWVTAGAYALAYLALWLSGVSEAALVAGGVLTASLVAVVCRLRWRWLATLGLAASAATYVAWLQPTLLPAGIVCTRAVADFWRGVPFPTLVWACFALGAHVAARDTDRPAFPARLAVASTFGYFVAFISTPHVADPAREWMFPAVLGAAHLGLALPARFARRDTLYAAEIALGVALVVLAAAVGLAGAWISLAWLAQAAVLVWLGVQLRERPLRWLGWVVFGLACVRAGVLDAPVGIGLPLWPALPARTLVLGACAATGWGLSVVLARGAARGAIGAREAALVEVLRWLGAGYGATAILLDCPDPWTVPVLAAVAAACGLAARAWDPHAAARALGVSLLATGALVWDAVRGAGSPAQAGGWLLLAAVGVALAARRLTAGRLATRVEEAPALGDYATAHLGLAILAVFVAVVERIAAPWGAVVAVALGWLAVEGAARRPFRHASALALAATGLGLLALLVAPILPSVIALAEGPRRFALAAGAALGLAAYLRSATRHGERGLSATLTLTHPAVLGAMVCLGVHLNGAVALGVECAPRWIAPAWAWVGVAGLAAACLRGLPVWAWCATGLTALAVPASATILAEGVAGGGRVGPGVALVAAWLALAAVTAARERLEPGGTDLPGVFVTRLAGIGAALFTAVLLERELADHWLSLGWAVEGATVLAVGFALGAREARYGGVAMLLFVAARVVIRDVSALPVPYRIASFLGLGLILLAASAAYARQRTAGRDGVGEAPRGDEPGAA